MEVIKDSFGYYSQVSKILIPSDVEELKGIICRAKDSGERIKVLGNATNILLARERLDLIIVKLEGKIFKEIQISNGELKVGAGVKIRKLLNFCLRNALGGLEFLVGIPGTVGGAIVGNAGAFGEEIANFILKIEIIDAGGDYKSISKEEAGFGYRESNLKDSIVVSASFKLFDSNPELLKERLREYFLKRLGSQELKFPSCGCFFKNPSGYKVKDLVKLLNLTGRRRGDAWISEIHGNFLISKADTRREDILSLKDLLQRRLWKEKRIWIEPEVQILW